jgi:hypothetical protein
MNRYRIEVQDTMTWQWRVWGGAIDGAPLTFPTRAAALAYWHDSAPGRNDICRVVPHE